MAISDNSGDIIHLDVLQAEKPNRIFQPIYFCCFCSPITFFKKEFSLCIPWFISCIMFLSFARFSAFLSLKTSFYFQTQKLFSLSILKMFSTFLLLFYSYYVFNKFSYFTDASPNRKTSFFLFSSLIFLFFFLSFIYILPKTCFSKFNSFWFLHSFIS